MQSEKSVGDQGSTKSSVSLEDLEKHENIKLLPRSDCGAISQDFRITSGSQASLMEFPWMALIAYQTS